MSFLSRVADFFTTASSWTGSEGILARLGHQAELSAAAIVAAAIVGVTIGAILGHTGRGGFVFVNSANAARAVPSFALLTILAIQTAFNTLPDFGFIVGLIVMFALAVPPILTNTYVGVRGVDPDVKSAASAIGMTGSQVLFRTELPLAVPLVMAGLRTAAVEVVATSTLAAYVGFSDLGNYIFAGLATQGVPGKFTGSVETFSGALLVAALALFTDFLLASLGRAVTPAGTRQSERVSRFRGVGADVATVRHWMRMPAAHR